MYAFVRPSLIFLNRKKNFFFGAKMFSIIVDDSGAIGSSSDAAAVIVLSNVKLQKISEVWYFLSFPFFFRGYFFSILKRSMQL